MIRITRRPMMEAFSRFWTALDSTMMCTHDSCPRPQDRRTERGFQRELADLRVVCFVRQSGQLVLVSPCGAFQLKARRYFADVVHGGKNWGGIHLQLVPHGIRQPVQQCLGH
jgi:hypothetical protein